MHVWVTGAAGFIASHVADKLLESGASVDGIDNFDPYYDPGQKRRNVARALKNPNYRLVEGDICDPTQVARALDDRKPDCVINLAACAGVRVSVEDPVKYLKTNELGALNVLEGCRARGGIPVVFSSTSSVYGQDAAVPFKEDETAVMPLSPYAATKRSSELMAYTYRHLHAQPIAILRFFTVYGPRGRPDMAVAKFTELLRSGQPIRMHGEDTERDFTYVDDVVDGVLGALKWVCRTRGFDTFNIGRGEPVRVRRLIEIMSRVLEAEPDIELVGLQPGESRVTFADTSKARAAFGYEPKTSLEEGVGHWAAWLETDEAPPPKG